MKISANNGRPRVIVTAHLDGLGDAELEGALARDLDEFQSAHRDSNLEFSASLFRAGMKISKKDLLGWAATTAAAVGVGVAATMASPLIGGALAAGAAGYALWPKTEGSFARNWFAAGKMGLVHHKIFKGNTKRSHLEAHGKSLTRIGKPEMSSLSPWKSNLISNMKAHPEARHIAFALGHGLGFESMAEHATGEWGEALKEAREESGREVDLLVLESCNMANLEGLSAMRQGARYAIATPLPIQTGNGLAKALGKLGKDGTSLLESSHAMVDKLTDSPGLDELGLFDLKALDKQLWPALNQVAGQLREGLDDTRAKQLLQVVENSDRAGQEGMNFRDLSSFLDHLGEAELPAKTLESVGQAKTALADTELTEKSDGLSFAPFPNMTAKQSYQDLDISESWKELFQDLSYFRITGHLRQTGNESTTTG